MITAIWVSILLIFYTFFGYGILLYFLIRIKRLFKLPERKQYDFEQLPSCTIIVAAYNEKSLIEEKIANTLDLTYPDGKLEFIFVTDGSTDGTPDLVSKYPEIKLLHFPERKGKISAVHRAIAQVNSEVIVFTDANTFLNKAALVLICRHYADHKVGAIAGEKRVIIDDTADATAGEGFYWKYESKLKKWDSELYSVVGAAGELFSIRKSLYEPAPLNSILDDFMISMQIAKKGYIIVYEPKAYAKETSSANIQEELKRKIRIAAGGIQSLIWLKSLLNPINYPVLSFQYISHRVLRWTIVPILIIAVFVLNFYIVLVGENRIPEFYSYLLIAQILFYLCAWFGKITETRKLRIKLLFIPYYFCVMNYAVLAGMIRYFFGAQSVIWEKALRK